MDSYTYPDELYCIRCRADVRPRIVNKVYTFIRDTGKESIDYQAAVCPDCGETLCDRDYDFAVLRLFRKEHPPQ